MSSSQTIKHYLGIGLLFLWGGVLLYFYATGRIVNYLPPDEGFHFFRTQCLIGGIVLCIIGLFNLLMSRREESCSHEHEHGHKHDHDHEHHDDAPDQARPHVPEPDQPDSHEPDPDRVKPHRPGPDHSPPPTPELVLAHTGHHHHDHHHASSGCCGHHHDDGAHGSTDPRAVAHIHGDQSLPQFMISVFLLAVPLAYSAMKTPDAFSINALENKGLYNNSAVVNPAAAAKYDLNKEQPAKTGVADLMAASKASGAPDMTAKSAPPVEKFSIKDLDAQVKKTAEGAYILEVPELFLSTADREVREVLEGLSVETTGQILPEKVNNPNGTRLRIMRLYVQCCAADASPMAFAVEFGKMPPEVKERSWVKITGKMHYIFEGGVTVPVLKAEKFEETEPLDEGMAY